MFSSLQEVLMLSLRTKDGLPKEVYIHSLAILHILRYYIQYICITNLSLINACYPGTTSILKVYTDTDNNPAGTHWFF